MCVHYVYVVCIYKCSLDVWVVCVCIPLKQCVDVLGVWWWCGHVYVCVDHGSEAVGCDGFPSCCKVNEGTEGILFREKFTDWPEPNRIIKMKGHISSGEVMVR